MAISESSQKLWRTAGRLSAVGIEMALSIVIGLGAGWWLDGKLDTEPALMITGLVLGAAAGFRGLIRAAKLASKEMKD